MEILWIRSWARGRQQAAKSHCPGGAIAWVAMCCGPRNEGISEQLYMEDICILIFAINKFIKSNKWVQCAFWIYNKNIN